MGIRVGGLMHEAGVAQRLIEVALEHLAAEPRARVHCVAVRVGELSGVSPDALDFAFACLARGTRLEGARLDLEIVPLTLDCAACGLRSRVEDYVFRCPACGSERTTIATGRELELRALEIDAAAEPEVRRA